jgi:hypothetical protein
MMWDTKQDRGLSAVTGGLKRQSRNDPADESEMKATSDTLGGEPGLSGTGLLVVEVMCGWEGLVSGVTQSVRGGCPSGLADELLEKAADAPGRPSGDSDRDRDG